jgi:hypothetical protein
LVGRIVTSTAPRPCGRRAGALFALPLSRGPYGDDEKGCSNLGTAPEAEGYGLQ